MKVLAAVSGGVDSAVALARAVEAGHDVTAVHLALQADRELTSNGTRGCCTISDAHDARRAADKVGAPFYVWDVAAQFRQDVIADFVNEYEKGRTPNPCIRCNEHIKFKAVLERGMALGFDKVVTGHYAQLDDTPAGPVLSRATDEAKDQSYVLAVLSPEQLQHCWFPVGDTAKPRIRAEAAERGLTVARKPDSHDICFIPDGDTAGFLRKRLGNRPGDVVEAGSGAVIGANSGTFGFTIGQRKGIGVEQPSSTGQPRYVLGIDPVARTVTVGEREDLAMPELSADDTIWGIDGPPQTGETVMLQVRAHAKPVSARVTEADHSRFTVELDEPVFGVAAGQSAVLYMDDRVIGQGTVSCG